MKRHLHITLVLASLATGSMFALGQQTANPPAGESSKQLIIGFFGFQGTRDERSAQTQTVDYIQHNPRFLRMDEITGARGNQAWVKAQEEAQRQGLQLVALNGIGLRNPVILIGEGDMVHAVYHGNIADPDAPGTTYEAFAFESFRVRDGKLSEHWDQVRLAPGWMIPRAPAAGQGGNRGGGAARPPAPPPDPPAGCSATPTTTAANKQLITSFFAQPATGAGARGRAALLSDDYLEHSPRFVTFNRDNNVRGRDGYVQAVEKGVTVHTDPQPRLLDHVVAECDYISVVWKQVLPDPDDVARTWEAFTFDAFRVREGKIAEHWDGDAR